MKIQPAVPADAAGLLEIYGPYVEHTAISFEYRVPSEEEFQERIRTVSARYPYLKAVDDGVHILGYAYAAPFGSRAAYDWAVETTVYVRRERRGQGIGRALYEALERALKEMGVLNLNACVACTSRPDQYLTNDSMYFHQRLGFRPVGTFHSCGCKFGRWYDVIWMEKLLGPHGENPPQVRFGRYEIQRSTTKKGNQGG